MPGADTANADVELLTKAARDAGDVARGYFKRDIRQWDKPDNLGPVTEADLEVDALLRERLTAARPGYGWLSEETPDSTARLDAEAVFIVDPIDGTRAFIEGNPTWSHSLAIARRGVVEAAVVFLPMHDRLYAARAGGGTVLNGDALGASERDELSGARVLAARSVMDPDHWTGGVTPDLDRHFRSSLAYRLALVAQGRVDAMITLRDSWEWDVAAGTLLITEAGGTVTDRSGALLRFNNPHPQVNGVVAGGTGVHRKLMERLA